MFLNPLGLLALIAVPAVIGLHLFRRRFRTQSVSALFLWESAPVPSSVGRRRTPLRRSPSFWIELALATVVALAIVGPRWFGATEVAHIVVVLDGSASMSAVGGGSLGEEGPEAPAGSVRGRVLEQLSAELDRHPANSRVTVLESGPRPRILYGPRGPVGGVLAHLESWKPIAGEHDFGPALDWATGLAEGMEVLFMTDTPPSGNRFGSPTPEDGSEGVRVLALGKPLDNLAIVDALRVPVHSASIGGSEAVGGGGAGFEAVYLTVANFGTRVRRVLFVLEGSDGGELARSELRLEAGETGEVRLESTSEPGPWVARLELDGMDALAFDDRVDLLATSPRIVRVHGVGERAFFEALGLAQPEGVGGELDRLLATFPQTVEVERIEEADWVIADRDVEGVMGDRLWIEPSGPERVELLGPFLTDARDPWVRGLRLDGVVWSHGSGDGIPGRALVMVDERPLVSISGSVTGDGPQRVVRMDYDPLRGTFSRVPDWPLFLGNQLENVRARLPGISAHGLRVGQSLRVRGLGAGTFHWTLPGGEVRKLEREGDWSLEGIDRPGVHRLQDPEGRRHDFSVALLDGQESDLRECGTGLEAKGPRTASTGTELDASEMLLLLVGLLLLAADWFVLARGNHLRAPAGGNVP